MLIMFLPGRNELVIYYIAYIFCIIVAKVNINSCMYIRIKLLYIFLDIFLLVMLGTALSSVIGLFLSSQGQISAIGSVVSSGYGFVSGAYMPLSSLGEGLRQTVMLLPGTYGTALLRSHATRGVLLKMQREGAPEELTQAIYDMIDASIYFPSGARVSHGVSYLILCGSIALLLGAYILISIISERKKNR